MIYHLHNVLTPDELRELRALAGRVRWDDGRKTAGAIAAPHKHNKRRAKALRRRLPLK
jgi:predicted 2-oxoglutarate/Fe(II)-dependent dioxygenase YbiX